MNSSNRSPKALRTLAISAAAIAAAGFVTACGGSDDKSSSSSAPASITIAYQAIPNGDLVVKNQGYLEKALPNTKINWKLFDSGGKVNEAVAANSVDIGLAGSSPVSRGLSQPLPYQVPWIQDVIGAAEALAVKADIKSIADLKGKKIATPLASTAHYSLLAALQKGGLTEKDVKIIDAEPDQIYAAWSRGDIDGAYVWNPNLAKILKGGGHTLITSADLAKEGKTTYDLSVITNSFIEKYPDTVKIWTEQQNKAVQLIQDSPEEAAKFIAAELAIPEADALAQLKDLIFVNAEQQIGADYLGGGLATNLFAAAEFNKELGQIPSVQPESAYQKAVNKSFAEQVAGQ